MGYYCNGEGFIKFKDTTGALNSLNSYIENDKYLITKKYEDICKAIKEITYENLALDLDKENYYFCCYDGKWHSEINSIFNAIAPHVEDGELEFVGEDGCHWKEVFKDGVCIEYSGRTVYEDEGMLNDQAKEDLKQLWNANEGDENTRSIIMSVLECVGCSEEFKSLLNEAGER